MTRPDLQSLPGIALVENEPVFNAPWEAQAFALVVNLHENGSFTWKEWATALSKEIHSGEEREYYDHWLVALENIVSEKSLTSAAALQKRKRVWLRAAKNTPHGQPIHLSAGATD